MFNGKLQLNQDGDDVVASITLNAPKGPVTLTTAVSIPQTVTHVRALGVKLDDVTTLNLAKKTAAMTAIHKLEQPLDHFNIAELVNPDAASYASSLWKTMTGGVAAGSEPKPKNKAAADKAKAEWKNVQGQVLEGDMYAMDVDYVLRRLAREHNRIYAAKNYSKMSGDDSMGGFLDNLGDFSASLLNNVVGSGDMTVLQSGMNLASSIPGVSDFASTVTAMSPGLAGFVDTVVNAANGLPDAKNFVSTTVKLANAGVPSAQADAARLKAAQDLLNKTPGISSAGGTRAPGAANPTDVAMSMVPAPAKILWGLIRLRTAAADAAAHAKSGVPQTEGMSLWDIGLFFGNKNLPSTQSA
jgi:hypothetical protein